MLFLRFAKLRMPSRYPSGALTLQWEGDRLFFYGRMFMIDGPGIVHGTKSTLPAVTDKHAS